MLKEFQCATFKLTPSRSKGKAGHTPYLKHSFVVHTATGATKANPFLCASGTGLGCHLQQPPPTPTWPNGPCFFPVLKILDVRGLRSSLRSSTGYTQSSHQCGHVRTSKATMGERREALPAGLGGDELQQREGQAAEDRDLVLPPPTAAAHQRDHCGMVEESTRLPWERRRARLRMGKAIHGREPHATWTKKEQQQQIYSAFFFFSLANVFRLDFKVRSNALQSGQSQTYNPGEGIKSFNAF